MRLVRTTSRGIILRRQPNCLSARHDDGGSVGLLYRLEANLDYGVGSQLRGLCPQVVECFFPRALRIGQVFDGRQANEGTNRAERGAQHVMRARRGTRDPAQVAQNPKAVRHVEGYEVLFCNHNIVMVSLPHDGAIPRSPSVLLVRLDAVGDALTLVPVIAALRRHNLRIGAVLRPVNAGVFAQRALEAIHIDGAQSDGDLVAQLHAQNYDAALIATEKHRGYQLARRAHVPRRIGFENGWGKPLKTLWVRRMCTRTVFRTAGLDANAPHECEVVFSLARALTGDFEPPRDARILRPLVIDDEPPADERVAFQVTDKWQRLGAPLSAVVEAAQRVMRTRRVRFVASTHERDYVQAFAQAANVPVESFDALEPWKNAIAAARAIVAPDSGAAHVAGMVGTPVVSCFSREKFALQSRRWSPWAAAHRVVSMEAQWPLVAADALDDVLTGSAPFSYTG